MAQMGGGSRGGGSCSHRCGSSPLPKTSDPLFHHHLFGHVPSIPDAVRLVLCLHLRLDVRMMTEWIRHPNQSMRI